MIKLMKDFDKNNRYDCARTGKKIMPGKTFYSIMVIGKSTGKLMRTKVVSEAVGLAMIAAGEAELVSR